MRKVRNWIGTHTHTHTHTTRTLIHIGICIRLTWCLKEFGSEARLATFPRYFYNVKRRMQITLLEWNNMVENAEDDACANWCCYTDEKQCLTRNLWRSFRPHTFTTPQPMHLLFFVFSLSLSLSLSFLQLCTRLPSPVYFVALLNE